MIMICLSKNSTCYFKIIIKTYEYSNNKHQFQIEHNLILKIPIRSQIIFHILIFETNKHMIYYYCYASSICYISIDTLYRIFYLL